MTPTSFPLAWPTGFPRSRTQLSASFKVSLSQALDDLYDELTAMKATGIVVSSNMEARIDGRPLAKQRVLDDPGVAVYFVRAGRQLCVPCDKWLTVKDNVRAVGLTIGALRSLDRWGAKETVDAAFQGFAALPATASGSAEGWWDVLGVRPDADVAEVKQAYRDRLRAAHPDTGGSEEAMHRLNEAYAQGREARS